MPILPRSQRHTLQIYLDHPIVALHVYASDDFTSHNESYYQQEACECSEYVRRFMGTLFLLLHMFDDRCRVRIHQPW